MKVLYLNKNAILGLSRLMTIQKGVLWVYEGLLHHKKVYLSLWRLVTSEQRLSGFTKFYYCTGRFIWVYRGMFICLTLGVYYRKVYLGLQRFITCTQRSVGVYEGLLVTCIGRFLWFSVGLILQRKVYLSLWRFITAQEGLWRFIT